MATHKETCGDLQASLRSKLDQLEAIFSTVLSDVSSGTDADRDIASQILEFLLHAKGPRQRALASFRKQYDKHLSSVETSMIELRREKAAFINEREVDPQALMRRFAEVEGKVLIQREMEKLTAKMNALYAATNSLITLLGTICFKLDKVVNVKQNIALVKESLKGLDNFEGEMVTPDDLVDRLRECLKSIQDVIDSITSMAERHDATFAMLLPARWRNVWKLSEDLRNAGGTSAEVKILWSRAMRRRSIPATVDEARSIIAESRNYLKKERLKEMRHCGLIENDAIDEKQPEPSPTTKAEEENKKKKKKETVWPGTTIVPWPGNKVHELARHRTGDERERAAEKLGAMAERPNASDKGVFETLLETFYDRLYAVQQEPETDAGGLSARVSGEKAAEAKRNAVVKTLAAYANAITDDGISPTAVEMINAQRYLNLFYKPSKLNIGMGHDDMWERAFPDWPMVWNHTIDDGQMLALRCLDSSNY